MRLDESLTSGDHADVVAEAGAIAEAATFDGEAPAWVVSLLVHLLLLIVLTIMPRSIPETGYIQITATLRPDLEAPSDPREFHFARPDDAIGAVGLVGHGVPRAAALLESLESEVPDHDVIFETGQIPVRDVTVPPEAPNVSRDLTIKGVGTVGVTGAMGAIDRITHEILLSLEQRPTLVVWLFDQSGSLRRMREAIRGRFERIYEELGVMQAAGNEALNRHSSKPLLTAVMAFGKNVQHLTEMPTDQLSEIQAAMATIETDPDGVERVFSAVYQAAEKYRRYRVRAPRRNVMIVVFTDEAGNDLEGLDAAAQLCRRNEIPVYVVGTPAPFGRRKANIKYVDPDPRFDQSAQWVPVDQGPESLMPERVKLHFPGAGPQDEPIDSGFGPYGLTRLSYTTGGLYFSIHPDRDTKRAVHPSETTVLASYLKYFFKPAVMRRYRPEYVAVKEYKRRLGKNKARASLVRAASLSWVTPMESPTLYFPKQNEAQLAARLTRAQRAAAKLEPKINRIHDILKTGESDRDELQRPRWQAGYDLAMGRVLAIKVRTETYNAMLAKAKAGLRFEKDRSDTWILRPADKVSVGSRWEKLSKRARTYLERVVQDHQHTPWAMLAQKELDVPFSWNWTETFTGISAPPQRTPGNVNPPRGRRDEQAMRLRKPKPKRPAPAL